MSRKTVAKPKGISFLQPAGAYMQYPCSCSTPNLGQCVQQYPRRRRRGSLPTGNVAEPAADIVVVDAVETSEPPTHNIENEEIQSLHSSRPGLSHYSSSVGGDTLAPTIVVSGPDIIEQTPIENPDNDSEYGPDGGLWRLEQLVPTEDNYYKDRIQCIPRDKARINQLTPVAFERNFEKSLPEGWKKHVHSEGKVYFLHEEDRIITESSMCDPHIAAFIDNDCRGVLSRVVDKYKDLMPDDYHVVVKFRQQETGYRDNGVRYDHYVADHDNSLIFWLMDYDGFHIDISEFGLCTLEDGQKQDIYKMYYWKHTTFFPHAWRPSKSAWNQLMDELTYAHLDVTISTKSPVYIPAEKMETMLRSVKRAQQAESPTSVAIMGRCWDLLLRGRIQNYHGQPFVRLCHTDSVYSPTEPDMDAKLKGTSLFFKIVSPFLLYAAETHLTALNELWTDKLTVQDLWICFIEKLTIEWKTYTVIATVFLNANVAFLAIPVVDDALKTMPLRSPSHIFSFLSTLSNLSGIILALFLSRHHRTRKHGDVHEIHVFLLSKYHDTFGFEQLAILYSLPYALLFWGVLLFCLAFFNMCFEGKTLWMHIAMSIALSICCLTLLWSIWILWEQDPWSTVLINLFKKTFGCLDKSEEIQNGAKKALRLRVKEFCKAMLGCFKGDQDLESGPLVRNQGFN